MSLAERLAGLDRIGIDAEGVRRLAWTDQDRATRAWFEEQARDCGLTVSRDPAGNLWAYPDTPPPWWGVGSHLDRAVLTRTDEDGIVLADAMRADGLEPARIGDAPRWLEKLRGFVELHIDQTTLLAEAGSPVGIVGSLASRMRLEVTLTGQADHAGTTPPARRHDALAAAARLIVAADEIGSELGELTVTSSRILVEPNATTTVAARVRLWIDARSAEPEKPKRWLAELRDHAERLSESAGVGITITIASQSAGQAFSPVLRNQLHAAGQILTGRRVPDSVCFAGHDAGVLAAKIAAAMVLVRNETGISHAPEEHVELEDAEIGVTLVERALRGLIEQDR